MTIPDLMAHTLCAICFEALGTERKLLPNPDNLIEYVHGDCLAVQVEREIRYFQDAA